MSDLSLLDTADETVRVKLGGETGAGGRSDLQRRLPALLRGGTRTLVVDVSGISRLSSTCVATLLWVNRTCQARHVTVVLAEPADRTLEVLRRTGLDTVFEIESGVS